PRSRVLVPSAHLLVPPVVLGALLRAELELTAEVQRAVAGEVAVFPVEVAVEFRVLVVVGAVAPRGAAGVVAVVPPGAVVAAEPVALLLAPTAPVDGVALAVAAEGRGVAAVVVV